MNDINIGGRDTLYSPELMAERSEVTGDHPAAAEPGPEIILIIIPDKILINSRQILQEFLIYCC